MRTSGNRLLGFARRFASATSGGIAIWTAIAVPPLAVMAVGAVELGSIYADKSTLQDAADAAALAGARELGFAGPGGVQERAKVFALEQAASVARRQRVTAEVTLVSDRGRSRDRSVSVDAVTVETQSREPPPNAVQVEMTAHRASFFGNLLPPGGFNTRVTSIASTLGSQPLCVVGMKPSSNNIHMHNTSRILSPACLVQSNANIQVDGGASIVAAEVQVAGTATGSISPSALTGAPALTDPFATRLMTFPTICNVGDVLGKVLSGQTRTLNPGMHCGEIEVESGGTLILATGTHYFRDSDIKIKGDGRLQGDGVVMIFNASSSIEAKESASIDLQGVRSGPWAGFVIVGPRASGEDFKFESGAINRLEGVIYLPNSKLLVDAGSGGGAAGSAAVGETSNWTVTLARELEVKGTTVLTINADYGASDVPVPPGVGPRQQGTRLNR